MNIAESEEKRNELYNIEMAHSNEIKTDDCQLAKTENEFVFQYTNSESHKEEYNNCRNELKKVRFASGKVTFKEYTVFRNLEIDIACNNGTLAMSVNQTQVVFDNCTFNISKQPQGAVIELNNGRVVFRNCHFKSLLFGSEGGNEKYIDFDSKSNNEYKKCFVTSIEQDAPFSLVRIQKCVFENCIDTFVHLQSGGRAEIEDTIIKGHKGNFASCRFGKTFLGDGIFISRSKFNDCSVLFGEKKESDNPLENLMGLMYGLGPDSSKNNHLLSGNILVLNQTSFINNSNYLIDNLDDFGGKMVVMNCSFHNDESVQSAPVKNTSAAIVKAVTATSIINTEFSRISNLDISGRSGVTNGVPVEIRDCEFSYIDNGINFANAKVSNCKFIKTSRVCLLHPGYPGIMDVSESTFVGCDSDTYLLTKTSHTQNGISTLKIQYFS